MNNNAVFKWYELSKKYAHSFLFPKSLWAAAHPEVLREAVCFFLLRILFSPTAAACRGSFHGSSQILFLSFSLHVNCLSFKTKNRNSLQLYFWMWYFRLFFVLGVFFQPTFHVWRYVVWNLTARTTNTDIWELQLILTEHVTLKGSMAVQSFASELKSSIPRKGLST